MSRNDTFVKRCEAVGLYEGSLVTWLEKVEQLLAENEALKQQVEQGKRDTVPEGYTLVPTEILGRFPEINPSNYDHDDACALNAWGVELVLATAPKQEK